MPNAIALDLYSNLIDDPILKLVYFSTIVKLIICEIRQMSTD